MLFRSTHTHTHIHTHQEDQFARNTNKTAAAQEAQQAHIHRQDQEKMLNAQISLENPAAPPEEDSTQYGFGVDEALMGQLATEHGQVR